MFARNAFVLTLAVGLAFGAAGVHAGGNAQSVLYPRVTGSGENQDIDYGPNGNQNTIVGGGRVVVSGSGENVDLQHLDPQFAQSSRDGLRPVTVGSGESSTTVWVPTGTDQRTIALIGRDGSLPRGVFESGNLLAAMR